MWQQDNYGGNASFGGMSYGSPAMMSGGMLIPDLSLQEFGFFCPGMETGTMEDGRWEDINPGQMGSIDGSGGMGHGGKMIKMECIKIGKGDEMQGSLRRRKTTHLVNSDPELNNPAYDQVGDNRQWSNWSISSWTPTGTVSGSGQRAISGSSQSTHDINTFQRESQKFHQLLNQVQSSGQRYMDQDFHPQNPSTMRGFNEPMMGGTPDTGKYTWMDAAQIYQGRYTIGSQSVGPNDVCQGELGDCYFICAISSVAEVPERARRLIYSREQNEVGVLCVALFISGMWEEVIIDDVFPTLRDQQGLKPSFARSRVNDLWVSAIEKAWAKVHGGYFNIHGGLISESLIGLTGAPVYTYILQHEPEDNAWKLLLNGERDGFIMTASTLDISKTGTDAQDRNTGLSGTHAYSLLSAHEVQLNGQIDRLVKLRNPWGQGEWKGDWSDHSQLWNQFPMVAQQVGLHNRNPEDGIFFMNFRDFRRYFNIFCVAFFHDNYVTSSKKYTSSPSAPTVVGFRINTPGRYYFSVHQINERMFPKSQRYTYSNVSIKVARRDQGRTAFIGEASAEEQLTFFLAECQPGEYVAEIDTPWRRNVNEFTLSIYGPELVQLESMNPQNAGNSFNQDVWIEKSMREKNKLKNFGEKGFPDIFYRVESTGTPFYFFWNQSSSTTVNFKVEIVDIFNADLLPPYNGQRVVNFTLQPGDSKVVVGKLLGAGARMQVSFSAEFMQGGGGGHGGNLQRNYSQAGNYQAQHGGYGQHDGGYGQGGYGQHDGGYGQTQGGFGQHDGGYGQQQHQGGYGQHDGGYGQQQHHGGFGDQPGGFGQYQQEFGSQPQYIQQQHDGGFGGDQYGSQPGYQQYQEQGFGAPQQGFGGDMGGYGDSQYAFSANPQGGSQAPQPGFGAPPQGDSYNQNYQGGW